MSCPSSTSSFRKSLALGAVLLGGACWALDGAWAPPVAFFGEEAFATKYERLRVLAEPPEVVAVGPSLVDMGFDAELFARLTGRPAFNLGVAGSDLYFQSILVRDLLLPLHEPELILWGVRDTTLSKREINFGFLESPALAHARGPLGARALPFFERLPHERRRRLGDWLEKLTRSPRYSIDAHGQTRLNTLRRESRAGESDTEGDADGEEEGEAAREDVRGVRGQRADYAVPLEEARAHFLETVRLCRARGIEVWILLTPYERSAFERGTKYAGRVLTGGREAYATWLTEAARARELPLLNLRYCAEVSDEERWFYDASHLNTLGAARFTEILARLVAAREVPEEWSQVPSRAELEAILGTPEPGDVPKLRLGLEAALAQTRCVSDAHGAVISAYGRLDIEERGSYGVELVQAEARVHDAALYVRLGSGSFREWKPPRRSTSRIVLGGFVLEPGEHGLEIHAHAGSSIAWERLRVVRTESSPR